MPSWYKNAPVLPQSLPSRTDMVERKASADAPKSSSAKKFRLDTSPDPDRETIPDISTQSSALLRLPPEIRNMVYGYVLTTNSGQLKFNAPPNPDYTHLTAHLRGHKTSTHGSSTLKSVCRKLYQETAFLEFKFNTLVFEQIERAQLEPDKQLLMLEELCPPTKLSQIKCVELHIKALATPYSAHHTYFLTRKHLDAYVRIARFCRRHPDTEVKYIFNSFSWHPCFHLGPESREFINQGIVLLKALRNINVSYLNPDPTVSQNLLRIGASLRSRRQTASWYAPNLRFFPNQDELDEESFRAHAGTSYNGVVGGLGKWIEVTKSWVKDGF